MNRPHAIALLAAFAASVLALPAIAQVTAFTYQGRLDLDGEPFTGDAVLAFRLFDVASGGAPIGPTSNVGPIAVTDGLITAQLDFGPGAFDGSARYLEVLIENPPGSTSFMILSPRQPILFTPMSQFANESAQWRSVGNAIINNNTGFVGINRDFAVGSEYFGVRAPIQSGYGGMYISTDTTDGLPFYGYSAGGFKAWTYFDGPTREWRLYNSGDRLRVTNQGFVSINAEPDASQQLLIESNTTAIVGRSTGNSGNGVTGTTTASSGVGVLGFATGTGSYGVYGESIGLAGYGGYFNGRGYYSDDVGIGTPPSYRLHVVENSTSANIIHFERTADAATGSDLLELEMPAGSAAASQFIEAQLGNSDFKFRVNADGNVTADGTYTAGGADFAELVPVSAGAETVEPGDVMVIDPDAMGGFARSHGARSTLVAGIYSTRPGLLGSTHDWDAVSRAQGLDPETADASPLALGAMLDEVPLAVVGIVPCKATTQNGPIRPGDLLVTSSVPGHAMRDDDPRNGTIVGKALEPLDSGTGVIRVLVTLQ